MDKIENEFRSSSLLLFLSEYESFGNVVVESILCGTPVLTSDIPAMREIFSGYPYFIINGKTDLFREIDMKITNLKKLKELTMKAREEFIQKYSLETI